jgi:hypothetical protein
MQSAIWRVEVQKIRNTDASTQFAVWSNQFPSIDISKEFTIETSPQNLLIVSILINTSVCLNSISLCWRARLFTVCVTTLLISP